MKREKSYFRECSLDEKEAGTPLDPQIKKRFRLANILITLFVLGLIIYSYFTYQFLSGIVAGLLILLYIHMLLFSKEKL
ncbi:hypothetical protein MSBRM_2307 [Methanosarcina barkeri MS]|nr:hypothetical protein MSBRM_2307 [Methanosarcina barkeri MS]